MAKEMEDMGEECDRRLCPLRPSKNPYLKKYNYTQEEAYLLHELAVEKEQDCACVRLTGITDFREAWRRVDGNEAVLKKGMLVRLDVDNNNNFDPDAWDAFIVGKPYKTETLGGQVLWRAKVRWRFDFDPFEPNKRQPLADICLQGAMFLVKRDILKNEKFGDGDEWAVGES